MDYRIQRLSHDGESRQYHLYDDSSKLRLVADFGSPWLAGLPGTYVRFGLPSGNMVALMDMKAPEREKNGRQHTAYAIQQDHAVFAIINRHTVEGREPYYVIEVADLLWLVLPTTGSTHHYTLYNEVPSDLMVYNEPTEAALPEPVGYVYSDIADFDYQIVLPAQRPKNPQLIALAFAFLIDEPE